MKRFIQKNIEYILLTSLYAWMGFCSIVNMGSIAGVVFLSLVVIIGIQSARASFCAMITILFGSMVSLNMPSPYIFSSAILFLINLTRLGFKGKQITFNRLVWPLLFFFLFRLLSGLYIVNEEMYISALTVDFITFISVCLAALLINNSEEVEFAERWVGFMGVLATICGLFFFLNNDTAYLRGLFADTNFAGKGLIEGDDIYKTWLRWVPIDKEPNFWAAFLLFPLGYWINRVKIKPDRFTVLFLSITYIGIIFSYSRSTFMVASFIMLFSLYSSKRKLLFSLILAFVVISIGVSMYSPEAVGRILSISDNIKTEGGSGRFALWGEAIDNFGKNPIIGIGTGQTSAYSSFHLGTHNLYLQILGENGLIAFALFVFMWFSAFFRMKRYYHINGFYFIAFLGYSINQMTIHNFDLRVPFFVMILFYVFSSNMLSKSNVTIVHPPLKKGRI